VARVVGRHGLSRLRNLEPQVPVRRYQRARAGELLHVDIKRLARIEGIGHRITGRRETIKRGVGYEYVHLCVDDATRLTYAEVLPCETWRSVIWFMGRALCWFAAHGILAERVMTDNGPCYLSHAFRSFCRAAGIRHLRTRPYTPRTNGKAERMVQTLLREWAYRFPFRSSAKRTSLLMPYLHFYNHHRAHRSLGERPPISRLNNVLRPDS
jgi:transposase InsO family protein